MRRIVIMFSVVIGLLLASGPMAGATNAADRHAAPRWSCDKQTCLTVLPAGSTTPRDASGCNRDVCITVTGTADTGYSTSGNGSGFYGYIHVWGPHLDVTGQTSGNPATSGSGYGAGKTCAEGLAPIGNGMVQSRGLPCEQVS